MELKVQNQHPNLFSLLFKTVSTIYARINNKCIGNEGGVHCNQELHRERELFLSSFIWDSDLLLLKWRCYLRRHGVQVPPFSSDSESKYAVLLCFALAKQTSIDQALFLKVIFKDNDDVHIVDKPQICQSALHGSYFDTSSFLPAMKEKRTLFWKACLRYPVATESPGDLLLLKRNKIF